MDSDLVRRLELRLGAVHARQRIGIEEDHEARIFGQGLNLVHIENWYSIHSVIRGALWLSGLYARGRRNAAQVRLQTTRIASARVPSSFDGFTILQISDPHVDMNRPAMDRVVDLLRDLRYDIAVLTGDYRAATFGGFEAALDGMARLRPHLRAPVYGVLGNHDTIRMLPGLEDMGIRMLLNEAETIARGGDRLHLCGIDDAHFFRVDNIEKAAENIPPDHYSILLSHTPEIYRQAAHAGFDLLLAGHTHGGQICLPGSIPITLDSVLPRAFGSGLWRYGRMAGYTSTGAGSSIVAVRFNCPPEITLHRLEHGSAQ
ncbi:metallophosphoesterase [Inquilinus limosus]|uniref:metallophosphoesterase n=1 Tax=Inquilinus limosus TaxID=171674 RepID=UPI0003F9A08E|nr:metallophosphoesterase [Inquilinus limosus]